MSVGSNELVLYIENDSSLYRSRFQPIWKNQERHLKSGRWNYKQSIKGWSYLVDAGAKQYAKESSAERGTESSPPKTGEKPPKSSRSNSRPSTGSPQRISSINQEQ